MQADSKRIIGIIALNDLIICIPVSIVLYFTLGLRFCSVSYTHLDVYKRQVSPICILRPGAITLEMLREIDKDVYIDPVILSKPGKDFKPKAPGMKYRHYAPKAPVKIIDGEIGKTVEKINEMVLNYKRQGKNVGIMATDETKGSYNNDIIISLGSRNNMEEISQNLFHVLRAFDNLDVDIILSECFEEKGIGTAIMNRLKKSAGFDILKV